MVGTSGCDWASVCSKMDDDVEREVFDMVNKLGALHLEEVCKHLSIPTSEGNSISILRRNVIRKLSSMDVEGAKRMGKRRWLGGSKSLSNSL